MSSTSFESESPRERFYRLRSDRTAKCLAGRLPPEIHCSIGVDEAWTQAPNIMPSLETLCNLIGRFCRQVSVVLSSAQRQHIDGDRLVAVLRASDPFGKFSINEDAGASDLHLRLGARGGPEGKTIYSSFRDWCGFVSNTPHGGVPPQIESAAGAETAACLAGAAAFRFWVERSTAEITPFGLDVFHMAEVSFDAAADQPSVDIGAARSLRLLLVGAGSVGSAAAYFLPRLGFQGFADVVDEDIVKVENLDRSPVFTIDNVSSPKAITVADYFRRNGVGAASHPILWNKFVTNEAELLRTHDIWLPLANEHGVRRAMQANFPPLCLQASTGRNWNVNFGRHIPFIDDCQIDRFPEESTVPLVCAEGKIETPAGEKVDAALPFASFMAGLFGAAAVMRVAFGKERIGDNAAFMSFSPTFSLWTSSREPRPHCLCREMNRAVWSEIWSGMETQAVAVPHGSD